MENIKYVIIYGYADEEENATGYGFLSREKERVWTRAISKARLFTTYEEAKQMKTLLASECGWNSDSMCISSFLTT